MSETNDLHVIFLVLTTNRRKLNASENEFFIPSASDIRSLQVGSCAQSLPVGISPLATAGASSQESTNQHEHGWVLTS